MPYHIEVLKTKDRFGPFSAQKLRKRLADEGYIQETETRWTRDGDTVLVRPPIKRLRKK